MLDRKQHGGIAGVSMTLLLTAVLVAPSTALAAEDALTRGDGRSLEAGELGQGAVVLVFMASWSPRCRDVIERVAQIQARWGDRTRLVIINFQEEPADMERFLAGKSTEAEIFYDRDGIFSKEYAITFLPGLLVLENGAVAFRGRLGRNPNGIIAEILG